jgi:hypothetical protein
VKEIDFIQQQILSFISLNAMESIIRISFPSAGKFLLSNLVGAQEFTKIVGEEIIDSTLERSKPISKPEKEIISAALEEAIEVIDNLFKAEGVGLDENNISVVKLAFAKTLERSESTSEIIVEGDLSPLALARHLRSLNTNDVRDLSEKEEAMYNRLIDCFSEEMTRRLGESEGFIDYFASETLKRQTRTLASIENLQAQADANQESLSNIEVQNIRNQNESQEIKQLIEELGNSLKANPVDDIYRLLCEAEGRNPGVSFQLVNQPNHPPTVIVKLKKGSDPVPAFKLNFPNTSRGRTGLEKLRLLIEKGQTASFQEGEFEWKSTLHLPEFMGSPSFRSLELAQKLPESEIPVSLDILNEDEKSIYNIKYLSLKTIRVGTKQAEMHLYGKLLPTCIVMRMESEKIDVVLGEEKLSNLSAKDAHALVGLHIGLL